MGVGPVGIAHLADFFAWFRQLETDNGGFYYLVASIFINIAAWRFKLFCDWVVYVVAYLLSPLNMFYIPVDALCHLLFYIFIYWQVVQRLQDTAVQKMQSLFKSRTLMIVQTIGYSILSPYFAQNIHYAPLLVWRIFFADSNLWYNLEDVDTPVIVYNIFAWLSEVSNTANGTFAFLNFALLGFVKSLVVKFIIYVGYASIPIVALSLFALLHRSALGGVRSKNLQSYYIQIGKCVPLIAAQFTFPFNQWVTGGMNGVLIIVAIAILMVKHFHAIN